MRPQPSRARRRGNFVALTAVMSVFLVGMVAFSVDMSWIALAQSELQNAADAAALAGAWPLMDAHVQYNLPSQSAGAKAAILSTATTDARAKAKEFASYNNAGGVTGLKVLDGDVEVGFTDAAGAFTPVSGGSPANFPNTVKVTVRRDATANGVLKLFFAPAIGTNSVNLAATARATTFAGMLAGFTPGKQNMAMLPVTYDYNSWMNFLKTGADPDGNVRTDAKGNPVLTVYPSVKQTGNFGLLSLDDSHVGASTVADWIANGVSPADIQTLIDHNLIPTSPAHNAWDWNGENGFKASNVADINQRVGDVMILPLFMPKTTEPYQAGVGNGSSLSYNIVGFVGVTIMPPSSKNREVVVQPTGVLVPNATFTNLEPTGATALTTKTTMFAPPKLTQ